MKRYFYSANPVIKKLLNDQFNLVQGEDQTYRNALLGALYTDPTKIKQFYNLRETVLNMTIEEQSQYANNYHLEVLFKHFDSLHRNSRGRSMILKGKQTVSKDIVDPDKFPVWDLKKKSDIFSSMWNRIMGKVRYDFGHELVVKNSHIEHPQGGRGVFVELSSHKKQINIGDFLGFVPGSVYDNYNQYKNQRLEKQKSFEKNPQHMHFPSGRVLELGQFQYSDSWIKSPTNIEPYLVNPYSLGHFINHPPYGEKPNVIITEMQCKTNFFPSHMRKYLPYNWFLPMEKKKKDEKVLMYGVFAVQPIQNRQELYVDYCENHIYPIESIPEWMSQPDYSADKDKFEQESDIYSLNFKKGEYENPWSLYWRLVEKQALKENQKAYENYLKVVKYKPNKVLHDSEEFRIRSMNQDQKPN